MEWIVTDKHDLMTRLTNLSGSLRLNFEFFLAVGIAVGMVLLSLAVNGSSIKNGSDPRALPALSSPAAST